MGQLRLANELWNALVEAERAHRDGIAVTWARHPEVAGGLEALQAAAAEVEAVEARMREARQEDETTLPRRADAEALAVARKAHRDAKAVVKAAKGAVIEAGAEPGFVELKAACRACQHRYTGRPDSLYREFGQRGLGYWTMNDVFARYRTAHAREKALRIEGKPSELKFHSFKGTGTLTVKVMRQAGDPVPSPELLASGNGKWRSLVQITPWSDPAAGRPAGAARRGRVSVRIGRARGLDPVDVDVPVVLHRWLPAGAAVKQVQVSRRRTGGHGRLSVSVVVEVPDPLPATADGAVAVFPSWKSDEAAGITVARVISGGSLPDVPGDLAAFAAVSPDRRSAVLRLPADLRGAMERGERIRGYRDRLFEHARDAVAAVLKEYPELEELTGRPGAEVSRWRSAPRLARLVLSWRGLLAGGGTEVPLPLMPAGLFGAGDGVSACNPPAGKRGRPVGRGGHEHDVECWRLRDRHLWEFEAHERDQAVARRRDAYRKAAAWLCEGTGAVTLHDLDVAALRRVPGVDREDTERARGGRGNAQLAAPGELMSAVKIAAQARGIQVMLAGRPAEKAEG